MKKVVLMSFVVIMTISLTGCGKSKEEKALDDFTDKMEKFEKDVASETKKMKKTTKEQEAIAKKAEKKSKKAMVKGSKEMKELKKCLVKADSKKEALDCHRELEDFTNDEVAAINTGVNEWTPKDKEKVLKQTDNLIKLLEMQSK